LRYGSVETGRRTESLQTTRWVYYCVGASNELPRSWSKYRSGTYHRLLESPRVYFSLELRDIFSLGYKTTDKIVFTKAYPFHSLSSFLYIGDRVHPKTGFLRDTALM
jgi:hypothetical protein